MKFHSTFALFSSFAMASAYKKGLRKNDRDLEVHGDHGGDHVEGEPIFSASLGCTFEGPDAEQITSLLEKEAIIGQEIYTSCMAYSINEVFERVKYAEEFSPRISKLTKCNERSSYIRGRLCEFTAEETAFIGHDHEGHDHHEDGVEEEEKEDEEEEEDRRELSHWPPSDDLLPDWWRRGRRLSEVVESPKMTREEMNKEMSIEMADCLKGKGYGEKKDFFCDCHGMMNVL